jgi:hypothetical protein
MVNKRTLDFLDNLNDSIDSAIHSAAGSSLSGPEVDYLRKPAPNICEWVTGVDYWNMPSCFGHNRQYQIMRDAFSCRCPICNSMNPLDIDAWGKTRTYLEGEVLLTWSESDQDFVCPKCRNSQRELIRDGMFIPYNEMIILAGMRSGKSYLGAHIGGYFEHFLSTRSMWGRSYLQRWLRQASAEWFEVSFAASTETQASQTIYAKYREMRKDSTWIARYTAWVKGHEGQQIGDDRWEYKMNDKAILDGWAKVRYNLLASDSAGIAGKTRISASIDEWARLADTEGSRSASELYRVLNQSLKTVRAAVDINELPAFLGMMVNVTSPISQDDPAMETYNKAKEGIIKRTYGWKGPTWEFNPNMPRHVFDEEYAKDAVAAERDFGANPPNAESPFVNDPARFWKSIDFNMKPIASFRNTYLTDPTEKSYVGLALESCSLDHTNMHYIFCDAGLNWDSFGMVCAHAEWMSIDDLERNGMRDESGNPITSIASPAAGRIEPQSDYDVVMAETQGTYIRPRSYKGINLPVAADGPLIQQEQDYLNHASRNSANEMLGVRSYDHRGEVLCTVMDFAVRIVPTADRDIWFNSVVNIVENLQKKIRIASVMFDRWNSESTIQQLRTMGLMASTVTLRSEHFMSFLTMAYNGRVRMLPPAPEDVVGITDTGALVIGTPQEHMHGQSVVLVELLKLNRSVDLRKFINPKKGQVRGRDSDDLARCYVGAHYMVQDSVVDEMANQKGKLARRKNQMASDMSSFGQIVRGGNW